MGNGNTHYVTVHRISDIYTYVCINSSSDPIGVIYRSSKDSGTEWATSPSLCRIARDAFRRFDKNVTGRLVFDSRTSELPTGESSIRYRVVFN